MPVVQSRATTPGSSPQPLRHLSVIHFKCTGTSSPTCQKCVGVSAFTNFPHQAYARKLRYSEKHVDRPRGIIFKTSQSVTPVWFCMSEFVNGSLTSTLLSGTFFDGTERPPQRPCDVCYNPFGWMVANAARSHDQLNESTEQSLVNWNVTVCMDTTKRS